MNFSKALEYLKLGEKLSRMGWLDADTFVYQVNGSRVFYEQLRNEAATHLQAHDKNNSGKIAHIKSHIDMIRSDGAINVGWTPTQEDMFAEDWFIR